MGRRREESTQITEDIEVLCKTHGALDAHELMVDLANAVGGSVAVIADALEKDEDIAAMAGVFSTVDSKETRRLIVRILSHCRATFTMPNGERASTELAGEKAIDLVYGDNLVAVYNTVKFALGLNYGGFFDVLAEAYNQVRSGEQNDKLKSSSPKK